MRREVWYVFIFISLIFHFFLLYWLWSMDLTPATPPREIKVSLVTSSRSLNTGNPQLGISFRGIGALAVAYDFSPLAGYDKRLPTPDSVPLMKDNNLTLQAAHLEEADLVFEQVEIAEIPLESEEEVERVSRGITWAHDIKNRIVEEPQLKLPKDIFISTDVVTIEAELTISSGGIVLEPKINPTPYLDLDTYVVQYLRGLVFKPTISGEEERLTVIFRINVGFFIDEYEE